MLFNSYQFLLVFLPLSLAVYALADSRPRLRIPTLVALSLVFYGAWNPGFLVLLIASIVLNWLAAQSFAATKRVAIIVAAIAGNLLVLFLFKYAIFFVDNIEALFNLPITQLSLILPLGISFFTFHHIMYLVDLRRGRAQLCSLPHYALYICFFPQAIAGPLSRWSEVGRQYGQQAFAPGWEPRFARGVLYIVIGLVEKTLLADTLGRALDPIYANAVNGPVNDGSAWYALAFGFQVFFDFSGYSDIAIGVGLLFGIELPENFNAPFHAASILQLWQRWHMTLSRFLRDYVFVPLSDLHLGRFRHTPAHYMAAILITMALCGLWHGAGWNFVLWGVLHGLAIVWAIAWRRFFPSPGWWLGWFLTVAFFLLTAVLFRAASPAAASHLYQGLFAAPSIKPITATVAICSLAALALPSTRVLVERLASKPRPAAAVAAAIAAVVVLLQIGDNETYDFIYFQF
jgi:alginate O-acetyltransferase complex protein AlgI